MLNDEERKEITKAVYRIIEECESCKECNACSFYTAFGDSQCKLAGFPIKWKDQF